MQKPYQSRYVNWKLPFRAYESLCRLWTSAGTHPPHDQIYVSVKNTTEVGLPEGICGQIPIQESVANVVIAKVVAGAKNCRVNTF